MDATIETAVQQVHLAVRRAINRALNPAQHNMAAQQIRSASRERARLMRTGRRELVKATVENWRARVRERKTSAATGVFAVPGAKGEPCRLE